VGAAKYAERLETGSVVEELKLVGDRLNYRLVSGAGPQEGWVAISIDKKVLLAPKEDEGPKQEAVCAPVAEAPAVAPAEAEADANVDPRVERCKRELKRPKISWTPVSIEQVQEHHSKRDKGMFFGLEFPWNEEMLLEFGASWLTKAFQAAGTMSASNSVKRIVKVKRHSFGNNGGKTLFEVEYEKPDPKLHTKLFAKYPFDMNDKKQQSDSMAQRVYKQPQDFTEINFYRLLEANVPFPTPKFYYGDISNLTTNFILISEQVNFNDPGTRDIPLKPFQIEGPYDKGCDSIMRSAPHEYYYAMSRKGAIMAAYYKTEKLAAQSIFEANFDIKENYPPEAWGLNPTGVSGDPHFHVKIKGAEGFMFDSASKIFPADIKEPGFKDKWHKLMMTTNAYGGESNFWRHSMLKDYVAFTHANLNPDNAYFWRDDEGKLDVGIFDWGYIMSNGIAHKFYWWIYTADWSMIQEHVRGIIDCVIDTYAEYGGPQLDRERFFTMYVLTANEHISEICKAVPLIYKMVPKKEFATIEDRKDPRIFNTIDEKSTCRVYLHCWCNHTRMINAWDVPHITAKWIGEFCRTCNIPPKTVPP